MRHNRDCLNRLHDNQGRNRNSIASSFRSRWTFEGEVESLHASADVDSLAVAGRVLGNVIDGQTVRIILSFALSNRIVLADRAGLLDSANNGDVFPQFDFFCGVRAIDDLDTESLAISVGRKERDRPFFDWLAIIGDCPIERVFGLATCASNKSEQNERDHGAPTIQRLLRIYLAAMFST
jgi:hypothetical protein